MTAPGKPAFGKGSSYAFGWVIDTADGHERIWHNGGTFGFTAANMVFPRDRTAVVVLQNDAGLVGPESTAMRVFEAFEPSAALAAAKPAGGEDPAITARVRDWIGRFESGDIDRAQLTAKMNQVLTPASVATLKSQLGALGAPSRLVFVSKTAGRRGTVYVYRAVFPATTFDVQIAINSAGKIAGFFIVPQ